jgi:aromatic-L-amino-acid/L-tryptophan decarboxylase
VASTTDPSTTEGPALPLPDREQVLEHARELIAEAWRSFDHPRPGQPLPDQHTRELLSRPLPREPSDANNSLDAAADVLDRSLAQARPRWFAYIGSSGLEIGVLADALMASHDVNVANSAGAADLLEAQTIRWIGQFVGFDENATGLLAAGGTIANLTALTAARERALPGVRHEGPGDRKMALYCSAEAHYSVRRAAEVLGIGGRNVRAIPIDAHRRMDVTACAEAIAKDKKNGVTPIAVVATAGTTLTGAVDHIDGLADVCGDEIWLHVDGAYGLPAASTHRAGDLFKGLPEAFSATVDAHKWMFVPKACSVLLMHGVEALEHAFSHQEVYMPHGEQLHAVDRSLEYSRPLRGLKLWLAFTVHGADAIRAAIERNLEQAALLADLIRADDAFELLVEPQLSAVCFRHVPPPGVDPDEHNRALARAVAADGRILLAPAEVDGATALRACFVNHRTTEDDVRAILTVLTDLATS